MFNKLCYRQLLLSVYVSCHSWNVVWIVKNGVIDAQNNQKLYTYKVNIEHKTFVNVLNTRRNEHARNCWRIVQVFRTVNEEPKKKKKKTEISFDKMNIKRCQMDADKFTYSQFHSIHIQRNILFIDSNVPEMSWLVCMLCT